MTSEPRESPVGHTPEGIGRISFACLCIGLLLSYLLNALWEIAPLRLSWGWETPWRPFRFFGHPWREFDFPFWYAVTFFTYFTLNRFIRFVKIPIPTRTILTQDIAHLFLMVLALLLVFWRSDFPTKFWMGGLYVGTVALRTVGSIYALGKALPDCPRPRMAALGVFLVFFLSAALISPWAYSAKFATGDEPSYLLMTASYVKDGDWDMANNIEEGDYEDFMYRAPDAIAKAPADILHAKAYPLFLAPAYALKGWLGAMWEQNIFFAMGALAIYLTLIRIGFTRTISLWGAASVGFSHPVFTQNFYGYPEIHSFAFMALGVLAFFKPFSWRWTLVGIVAAAALVALKVRYVPAAAALYVLFFLRAFLQPGQRAKSLALLLPAIPLYFVFYENLTPYSADRDMWNRIDHVAHRLFSLLDPAASDSPWTHHPLYDNFWTIWLDQAHGLLIFAPLYLLMFAGIRSLKRDHADAFRKLMLLLPVPVAILLLRSVHSGWSPTLRYMVYMTPVLAPLIAAGWNALSDRSRPLLISWTAAWSFGMVAAICVFPALALPTYWDFGGTDLGWSNHLAAWLDTEGFPLRLHRLWPSFHFPGEMNYLFPLIGSIFAGWLVFRNPRPSGGYSGMHLALGSLGMVASLMTYIALGSYLAGGEETRYNLLARFEDGAGRFEEERFTHRFLKDRRSFYIRGNMLNGPYMDLPPGEYLLRYGLHVHALEGCGVTLAVRGYGEYPHATRRLCEGEDHILYDQDPYKKIRDYYVRFSLDQAYRQNEFRLYADPGSQVTVYRIDFVRENTLPALAHYAMGRIDEALGAKRLALRRYIIALEMGKGGPWIKERIRQMLTERPLSEVEQEGLFLDLDPDPGFFDFVSVRRAEHRIRAREAP